MKDILSKVEGIESLGEVSYTDEDDKYLYVVSTDDCTSRQFRSTVANYIFEKQGFSLSLEVRTKEDSDGFIAIVGDTVEHPIQTATIACGILELDDRHTYQCLTKTSELTEKLYDGENTAEFSVAVIVVVSTIIDDEPLDIGDVADKTDLDARIIQSNIKKIVQYMES